MQVRLPTLLHMGVRRCTITRGSLKKRAILSTILAALRVRRPIQLARAICVV